MVQLSPEVSSSHINPVHVYTWQLYKPWRRSCPWSNSAQSYHCRTLRCNLRLVTLQTSGGDHVPWSNLAQSYAIIVAHWGGVDLYLVTGLWLCRLLEVIMTHGPL